MRTRKQKLIFLTSDAASEEAVYEFVEEDSELEVVGKVFSELMDDDVELK